MTKKVLNGTRLKLIYGTLPTVDFPDVYNITLMEDFVAERSGDSTFRAKKDGEPHAGAIIKHVHVGEITRSGVRFRLVITDDTNLEEALEEAKLLIIKEFEIVIQKLEQKRIKADSEFNKAKNGISVSVACHSDSL